MLGHTKRCADGRHCWVDRPACRPKRPQRPAGPSSSRQTRSTSRSLQPLTRRAALSGALLTGPAPLPAFPKVGIHLGPTGTDPPRSVRHMGRVPVGDQGTGSGRVAIDDPQRGPGVHGGQRTTQTAQVLPPQLHRETMRDQMVPNQVSICRAHSAIHTHTIHTALRHPHSALLLPSTGSVRTSRLKSDPRRQASSIPSSPAPSKKLSGWPSSDLSPIRWHH